LINSKILYLIILHNYSRYLMSLNENNQALSFLEQANILASQLFKQDNISNQQFGSLLNDLALGYYGKQDYRKAIETFNSALIYLEGELKNIENNKTNSDFDYTRAKYDINEAKLINLSNTCSSYFALKDFQNAKENCKNALKLFNKNNFGENFIKNDLVKEIEEIKKLINEINKHLVI
jgi:tetratricopeptide (TPR) repeat protein